MPFFSVFTKQGYNAQKHRSLNPHFPRTNIENYRKKESYPCSILIFLYKGFFPETLREGFMPAIVSFVLFFSSCPHRYIELAILWKQIRGIDWYKNQLLLELDYSQTHLLCYLATNYLHTIYPSSFSVCMGGWAVSDRLMDKETTGNCIPICCQTATISVFSLLRNMTNCTIWETQQSCSFNRHEQTQIPWALPFSPPTAVFPPPPLFKYNNGLGCYL